MVTVLFVLVGILSGFIGFGLYPDELVRPILTSTLIYATFTVAVLVFATDGAS